MGPIFAIYDTNAMKDLIGWGRDLFERKGTPSKRFASLEVSYIPDDLKKKDLDFVLVRLAGALFIIEVNVDVWAKLVQKSLLIEIRQRDIDQLARHQQLGAFDLAERVQTFNPNIDCLHRYLLDSLVRYYKVYGPIYRSPWPGWRLVVSRRLFTTRRPDPCVVFLLDEVQTAYPQEALSNVTLPYPRDIFIAKTRSEEACHSRKCG